MMLPMSELMSDRKTVATVGAAGVHGNDSLVAVANDPCLAPLERMVPNASANVIGDCLKVDLVRFGYA